MIRDNINIFVYFINTACMKDSVAFQNKNNYWCMHAMNNEHIHYTSMRYSAAFSNENNGIIPV